MRQFYQGLAAVVSTLFLGFFIFSVLAVLSYWNPWGPEVKEPSLLTLRLQGVLADSEDFLQKLRSYRDNPNIKGILIQIDSPGGLVGTSQEIYSEIKRVKEEYRKPVVVTGESLVAGGAYLAAVGANRIVANPGTLIGSVGVSISSSKWKHPGAMLERGLLINNSTNMAKDLGVGTPHAEILQSGQETVQSVLGEMQVQFKQAIQTGRSLSSDIVNKYSDGRVFTGETAVRIGFVDQIGTFEDARRVAGDLAGLGAQPKLFYPIHEQDSWWKRLKMKVSAIEKNRVDQGVGEELSMLLQGRPLYLMPGTL